MINRKPLEASLAAVKKAFPKAKPKLGMILGSGLSEIADAFEKLGEMSYEKIPGLGKAGVAGHAGRLLWGKSAGIETFVFQGRRHVYEGVGWEAVATPSSC
jgi:purine-nucleoside phosphorylase